jgi:hypothetical protein
MIVNLTLPHFAAIVTGVGTCIVDALNQTPAGAPDRQCLLLPTAVIPWDGCSCDGQVALAITSVYGSQIFPTPATPTDWTHCGPNYWVANVVASVVRCVTGINQLGEPPPCATALAEAIRLENDRSAVRQAISCCLDNYRSAMPPTFGVGAWVLLPSSTVGEQGACAGSETTFQVGVRACACPPT